MKSGGGGIQRLFSRKKAGASPFNVITESIVSCPLIPIAHDFIIDSQEEAVRLLPLAYKANLNCTLSDQYEMDAETFRHEVAHMMSHAAVASVNSTNDNDRDEFPSEWEAVMRLGSHNSMRGRRCARDGTCHSFSGSAFVSNRDQELFAWSVAGLNSSLSDAEMSVEIACLGLPSVCLDFVFEDPAVRGQHFAGNDFGEGRLTVPQVANVLEANDWSYGGSRWAESYDEDGGEWR